MSVNPLTSLQTRRNAEVAKHWTDVESHRNRLTKLLVDHLIDDGKHPRVLCVLGAGNCNDLDLSQLLQHYDRIDLVDLDNAAMQRGVSFQDWLGHDAVQVYGDRDVTGIWARLAALQGNAVSDQEVDGLVDDIDRFPGLSLPCNYITVASTCLLSQLIDAVNICIGPRHPRYFEVVAAIRLRHLHLMAGLLTNDGIGLLVTDFVSSATCPELPSVHPSALPGVLASLIETGNFFTGLNPHRLVQILREDPHLSKTIEVSECENPWLWNLGPRHYAVTAIRFRKRFCRHS